MEVTRRDVASADGFGCGSIDSAGNEGRVWRFVGGGWTEKGGNVPGGLEDVVAIEGRPLGDQVG